MSSKRVDAAIGESGGDIEKLSRELGLDADSLEVAVLFWRGRTQHMDAPTVANFRTAAQAYGAMSTMLDWQKKLKADTEKLFRNAEEEDNLREFSKWLFKVSRDKEPKLDMEIAIVGWEMLFSPRFFTDMDKLPQFAQQRIDKAKCAAARKRPEMRSPTDGILYVTQDEWEMLLELALILRKPSGRKLFEQEHDDSWPQIVDDYMKWLTTH